MYMHVDEAWRNDVATGVDRRGARQFGVGDCFDATTLDPDIANGIQLGLRIYHPTVQDYEVITLREGGNWHGHYRNQESDNTC